ncbi:HAD-IIA family hydrolase [Desulfoplanes formicivorans]|uniref:HAD family hydrolase n=1 Tax=Desulfoplanes formicivorans TaxID=1592317 RepID=A0A194ABD7_9BACT|nr:HAD-IIA family hydrolase [Desulfoplanes formicivorans]GAU07482.1 HAD family hydrolase [Desulfoplanes formicivorans]
MPHPILAKQCFIFDLDGTVYLGDQPIAGTVRFIQNHWNSKDFFFLTNNTSKNLHTYLDKLHGLGIPATLNQILSPLIPLVDHLHEQAITRVYPVGNQEFTAYLAEHLPGCVFTDDPAQCQAVLVGYDTELTYAKLRTSCLLLHNPDIAFLATHPDKVCPSPQGPLPDTGSFLALYEAATNRIPEIIFGKPNTVVLHTLLKRYEPHNMVMIGDRLYTDMVLARNAGLDSILVLSGESSQKDVDSCSDNPTWVLPDLGGI